MGSVAQASCVALSSPPLVPATAHCRCKCPSASTGQIREILRSETIDLEVIERGRSDCRRGACRFGPSGCPGAPLGEPGDGEDLSRTRLGTEPRVAHRGRDRLDPRAGRLRGAAGRDRRFCADGPTPLGQAACLGRPRPALPRRADDRAASGPSRHAPRGARARRRRPRPPRGCAGGSSGQPSRRGGRRLAAFAPVGESARPPRLAGRRQFGVSRHLHGVSFPSFLRGPRPHEGSVPGGTGRRRCISRGSTCSRPRRPGAGRPGEPGVAEPAQLGSGGPAAGRV